MHPIKPVLALTSLLISTNALAINAEHVVWDKTPIHLNLTLDEERIVHFPQPISIIDSEAGDSLAVLKVQDTLYLKAKADLHNKRLLVQLMPQGEVIILNLSADKTIHTSNPVDVVLEKSDEPETHAADSSLNAVTLTRFAIQSIYAPERLLVIPEGVNRTPMQTQRIIPLFYGASIEARPLISWHGGDFYVTAVELKNQLKKEMVLDPRKMVGNWQSAAFYPTNTLAGRGGEDTATVFLVSVRPFNEALAASREFVR